MNENKITKMLEHEPYSCIMKNYEFADILFENEGLMTVPKNSANTIVELLNTAYKYGVKSTIKQYSMVDSSSNWVNGNFAGCTNSGLTYSQNNIQQIEPVKQINNFTKSEKSQNESDKQINVFKSKKKLFKIF